MDKKNYLFGLLNKCRLYILAKIKCLIGAVGVASLFNVSPFIHIAKQTPLFIILRGNVNNILHILMNEHIPSQLSVH